MEINKKLSLVIPLTRGEDAQPSAFVHVTPLSREAFEKNFAIIAKAFSIIMTEFGAVSAPRVAALTIRKVAAESGRTEEVEQSLMVEMLRLSHYIAPGPNGWAVSPLSDALQRNLMDADEASEVENITAFFMLVSSMHLKRDLMQSLALLKQLWGAPTTSLLPTAYAGSLPISTGGENSGETKAAA